jgi:hypothetical protein
MTEMQTPIQTLPTWNMDEFLNSLIDLPLQIFQWATDTANDKVLRDLIIGQSEQYDGQRFKRYMECTGHHGPPITIAIKSGNLVLLDLLLAAPGIDIQSRDSDHKTPLSVAVKRGETDIARMILEYGRQRIHEIDIDHDTALVIAAKAGTADLRGYPRPLGRYASWATPLLTAIELGERDAGGVFQLGRRVTLSNVGRNVDMHIMPPRERHGLMVSLLLLQDDFTQSTAAQTDWDIRSADLLTTPLELALVGDFQGAINTLLGKHPSTPHDVFNGNTFDFLFQILHLRPDLANGGKPLIYAAGRGCTEIVSLLMDHGAEIDRRSRDEYKATSLWMAALRGHLDTVKVLVERGANKELTAALAGTDTTAL